MRVGRHAHQYVVHTVRCCRDLWICYIGWVRLSQGNTEAQVAVRLVRRTKARVEEAQTMRRPTLSISVRRLWRSTNKSS